MREIQALTLALTLMLAPALAAKKKHKPYGPPDEGDPQAAGHVRKGARKDGAGVQAHRRSSRGAKKATKAHGRGKPPESAKSE
jgi:hypothetical protein